MGVIKITDEITKKDKIIYLMIAVSLILLGMIISSVMYYSGVYAVSEICDKSCNDYYHNINTSKASTFKFVYETDTK